MTKKVFISQPMNGLTDEEILVARNNILATLKEYYPDDELELVDSFFEDFSTANCKNIPVAYLGKAISKLAEADICVLGKGWDKARGCKIEAQVALNYGITVVPMPEADMNYQTLSNEAEKTIGTIAQYNMNFSEALILIKKGTLMCRKGWNGKNMCIAYQKGYPQGIPCNKQTAETWGIEEGSLFKCKPYLQIKNADGTFSIWVPSIGDVLADDWMVYNP